MNAPIDTLAFAQRFEEAGFGHEQARALAAAFGQARESTREGLVTKDYLDARLAEFESRMQAEILGVKGEVRAELSSMKNEVAAELSSLKIAVSGELSSVKSGLREELSSMKVELVREIATVGKDVSGRLWSTITIVAGVTTAISAAVGAATALLLKFGGI